jgi:RNA polymerase sigma-54 factor
MRLSPEDRAAVQVLIDSLNEDGYLADTLDEIALQLCPTRPTWTTAKPWPTGCCALRWLQSLEPAGRGRAQPVGVPAAAAARAAAAATCRRWP